MKFLDFSRMVALAFGVLVFAPSIGTAQNTAQKSVITQLLWQSLLQCYEAPPEFVSGEDLAILHVDLSELGDITDLPRLTLPDTLSSGERALVREATVALINCTPFISAGRDKAIFGTFDMVLNQAGLALANVDAQVVSPDLPPEPTPVVEGETPEVTEETTRPIASSTSGPETEEVLALNRTDRRELQRRLVLLDYNTRGVDGVFGPGSRRAIEAWQVDNDITPTGYFDEAQVTILRDMSEEEYVAWTKIPRRYTDRNGCLRETNGKIVEGRSFKCDLSAAGQGLGISR